MIKRILIYNDNGTDKTSHLADELNDYFSKDNIDVMFVSGDEILHENCLDNSVVAFFMPGGAANPYRDKLEDPGNKIIFDYVQKGGIYCGICAGAYFACRYTEFEKGIKSLEIKEEYGLNLIEGQAIGSLHKELNIMPYSSGYKSIAIPELLWEGNHDKKLCSFYQGGPYFVLDDSVSQKVLARYKNIKNNPPAIVARNIGKGLAIVSGVHFEFSLKNLIEKLSYIVDSKYNMKYTSAEIKEKECLRKSLFMQIADVIKQNIKF